MALRLQVRLRESADAELVNVPLPPVKCYVGARSAKSEECYTPAGLPLRFYAHFRGNWGDIVVLSVKTELLRLGTHVNCYAELRLPTDEVIVLGVVDYQPAGGQTAE